MIIEVKNLKTNSCEKNDFTQLCQSYIQLTRARAYVKPTLEIYVLLSLQGQFLGFHFLIFVLKSLKLSTFL